MAFPHGLLVKWNGTLQKKVSAIHTLWLVMIFGIPAFLVLHWGLDVWHRRAQDTVARLIMGQHFLFFVMMFAVFAIQVLPVKDAGPIAVFGVGSAGVLLWCMGIHLCFKILGWPRRMPGLTVGVAYIGVIPWVILAQNQLFHDTVFYRQAIWIKPYYAHTFHEVMGLVIVLIVVVLAVLFRRLRQTSDPVLRGKIGGIFWGGAFIAAAHLFGAVLLPFRTPAWLPPYPYLGGTLGWLIIMRYTVLRFEFLPSRLDRYRTLFDLSRAPIVMTDANGQIVERNPAAVELVGTARRSLLELVDPANRQAVLQQYRTASTRKLPLDNWGIEIFDEEGNPRSVEINSDFVQIGDRIYGILVMRDNTAEKQQHETLTRLAYHDPLTGLPNATQIQKHLEAAVHEGEARHKRFALMMADLDNFKTLNDTLGHQSGNQALAEVARRLTQNRRGRDLVARFGGDEFILFLAEVGDGRTALKIADRMLREFIEPVTLDGHRYPVTVSIGIALFPDHGRDADALIKSADTALYTAKRLGKFQACLFSPGVMLDEEAPVNEL